MEQFFFKLKVSLHSHSCASCCVMDRQHISRRNYFWISLSHLTVWMERDDTMKPECGYYQLTGNDVTDFQCHVGFRLDAWNWVFNLFNWLQERKTRQSVSSFSSTRKTYFFGCQEAFLAERSAHGNEIDLANSAKSPNENSKGHASKARNPVVVANHTRKLNNPIGPWQKAGPWDRFHLETGPSFWFVDFSHGFYHQTRRWRR